MIHFYCIFRLLTTFEMLAMKAQNNPSWFWLFQRRRQNCYDIDISCRQKSPRFSWTNPAKMVVHSAGVATFTSSAPGYRNDAASKNPAVWYTSTVSFPSWLRLRCWRWRRKITHLDFDFFRGGANIKTIARSASCKIQITQKGDIATVATLEPLVTITGNIEACTSCICKLLDVMATQSQWSFHLLSWEYEFLL